MGKGEFNKEKQRILTWNLVGVQDLNPTYPRSPVFHPQPISICINPPAKKRRNRDVPTVTRKTKKKETCRLRRLCFSHSPVVRVSLFRPGLENARHVLRFQLGEL